MILRVLNRRIHFLRALFALFSYPKQWHKVGRFAEVHVNAGGSAIPGGGVFEHTVTHVGRDHVIAIRSEMWLLQIASVQLDTVLNLGAFLRAYIRSMKSGHDIWLA